MRKVFFCVLGLMAGVACAQGDAARQLLLPGVYHGDEVPAQPGTGWLALVVVDGRWHLVPTEVKVEPMPGEEGDVRLATPHPKAMALLRAPVLQAGKVDTPDMRFMGNTRRLRHDAPLNISFKRQSYQLVVMRNGAVALQSGQQRSELPDFLVSEDQSSDFSESTALLWAGDLDGDGKLDLLMGYERYNQEGACLFLSSAASPGQLVGRPACVGRTGC